MFPANVREFRSFVLMRLSEKLFIEINKNRKSNENIIIVKAMESLKIDFFLFCFICFL